MSIPQLIVWSAAFLVVSLIGLFISAKTINIDLHKNGDLIRAMLNILGTLVSVMLALLVSGSVQYYMMLHACVNDEATSVNEIFRLSKGFPSSTASLLQELCIDYCEKVIADEWPAMKQGTLTLEDNKIFSRLDNAIVKFHASNVDEAALKSASLKATSEIARSRGLRILASRSSWTWRLLPLLLACAIIVMTCCYLYVGKGSALLHSILVGLVAIALGTCTGVIFLMARPFASEWAIQPEGFKVHAEDMRQYRNSNTTE